MISHLFKKLSNDMKDVKKNQMKVLEIKTTMCQMNTIGWD